MHVSGGANFVEKIIGAGAFYSFRIGTILQSTFDVPKAPVGVDLT